LGNPMQDQTAYPKKRSLYFAVVNNYQHRQ